MATPLLTRRSVLAVREESSIGTAVALSNTYADFRVYDAAMNIRGETIRRDRQGALGSSYGVAGRKSVEATFRTHLHGSGSAGTPPDHGRLYTACGMSLATATYTATSDTSVWKTMTMGHYLDGRRKLGRGMMGNLVMTFRTGEPVDQAWTFLGGYEADPTDTTLLSGMSYESVKPPVWSGAGSLTIDGSTAILPSEITFDLGNQVALREDANSAGGYLCGWIGQRLPTITMDPEAVLVATKDWHGKWSGNTEIALTIVVGATAGNICTISFDNLQLANSPEDGDRDGKATDQLTFHVNEDNIEIAFT